MAIVTTITKIFKKILTIGIPPEDDVLYSKVVKRKIPNKSAEALVLEDFKNAIHTAKSKILNTIPPTEERKGTVENIQSKTTTAKKSASSEKTGTDKKTSTRKATTKKSKTETSKKPPAKKISVKKDTGTKTETKKKTKTTTAKKIAADKKSSTAKKKAVSSKKPATESKKTTVAKTKGSKKEAKIALYTKDIKKHYSEVNEAFLAIIVKNLGPSIYRKDAELVSCSDPKELDTVRRNFLVKKLGLELRKEELDAAIQEVCQELKSTRTKYRATFYYRLAQKFKKESVLS